MSVMLGKLCALILQEHFGETVSIVGSDLFTSYGKNLSMIVKTTNLEKSEVSLLTNNISLLQMIIL